MESDSGNFSDSFVNELNKANDGKANKKFNGNAKRRTIVGPWKNVSEFNKVYEWIFGAQNSTDTRQKALSQIQIWNLRRSTLCPAAVLATHVLLSVQLKDTYETKFTNEELQILYSNAFTRFFNFMSSIMQSQNMRTMYETAMELGLPSFVVDLRHICAHGQVMPPLQVLRNTAEYCISWLHDYYWSSQRNTICDIDAAHIRRKEKNEFDVKISELFEIYDSALEAYMKGATNQKTIRSHLHGKRLNCVTEFCKANNLTSLEDSFNVIVQQLCALVKASIAIKDMTEIYVEAFLKMKYFFTLHQSHTSDEDVKSLMSVTQTLFRMLAVFGFIEELFLSLLEITESTAVDAITRAGARFWAVEIAKGFQAFRLCKQMYKAELDADTARQDKVTTYKNPDLTKTSTLTRKLYTKAGVDMKRTIIFGDHFRRPWVWIFERNFIDERLTAVNEYTAPILKSILNLVVPELSKTEMHSLSVLIDYRFEVDNEPADCPTETDDQVDEVYTDLDLLKEINEYHDMTMEVDDGNMEDTELEEGIWTIIKAEDSHDWKLCPLGRLPWE